MRGSGESVNGEVQEGVLRFRYGPARQAAYRLAPGDGRGRESCCQELRPGQARQEDRLRRWPREGAKAALRCLRMACTATTGDARRPATRAMPMASADRRPQVDVCRIITCGQAFRLPATLASRLNVCARHWPASTHPPCAWPFELVTGCCRRFARRFKRASQERTHRSSRVALSSAVACMSFHSGTVPALVPCVNVGKRVIRCLVTRAVSRRRSAKCEGAGLAVAPRPAQ